MSNLEWHILPSDNVLPLNDAYLARMYPQVRRDFMQTQEYGTIRLTSPDQLAIEQRGNTISVASLRASCLTF